MNRKVQLDFPRGSCVPVPVSEVTGTLVHPITSFVPVLWKYFYIKKSLELRRDLNIHK